jgi:hypothetical protein
MLLHTPAGFCFSRPTHLAIVRSSGRLLNVQRMGKALVILDEPFGWRLHLGCQGVRFVTYDRRFKLLPACLA